MQHRILNELQNAGNSMKQFVLRMGGNEDFVLMMMKKFLNDPTFLILQDAIKRLSYEEIENAAHTLKGVALNLGLDQLSFYSKRVQQAAKAKDQLEIRCYNNVLRAEYEKIVRMIQEE